MWTGSVVVRDRRHRMRNRDSTYKQRVGNVKIHIFRNYTRTVLTPDLQNEERHTSTNYQNTRTS